MISDKQLLAKVESNEDLTVDEVKRYYQITKPQKHVYGKYGTLKRKYLEDIGLDWTIVNLPEYLHGVYKQAEDIYNVLYAKLSQNPLYKRTGTLWKITAGLLLCNTPSKKKYLTN